MKTHTEAKRNAPASEGLDQVPGRRTAEGRPAANPELAKDGEPVRVPLDLLDDNPDQPRQFIDPDYIEELAETIRQRGLIHRIVVRRIGGRFQIVAGHCRRNAYKRLRDTGAIGEWTAIPADIVQVSDEESALHCLLENIEREDLSPAEEGAAYARLMTKYGLATAKALAERLGIDEQRVARRMRIHEGPDCIKRALTRGLKVPVGNEAEGGGKKNATRRLTFDAALEFLKLYEYQRRKNPGTEGGRPDGRPIADVKTEPVVMRALSEGWSRQRIRAQVERVLADKSTNEDEATAEGKSAPMFEVKADRFVVFTKRLARASAGDREAVLEQLRKTLASEEAQA